MGKLEKFIIRRSLNYALWSMQGQDKSNSDFQNKALISIEKCLVTYERAEISSDLKYVYAILQEIADNHTICDSNLSAGYLSIRNIADYFEVDIVGLDDYVSLPSLTA